MKTLKALTVGDVLLEYENKTECNQMLMLIKDLRDRISNESMLFINAIYGIKECLYDNAIKEVILLMTSDAIYDKKNCCYKVSSLLHKFIRTTQNKQHAYVDGPILFERFISGSLKYVLDYKPGSFYPYLAVANLGKIKGWKHIQLPIQTKEGLIEEWYSIGHPEYNKLYEKYFTS